MNKKSSNNIAKILLAFGVLASPIMLANQVSADNTIANTTNNVNSALESEEKSDAVTTNNVVNSKEEKTQPSGDATTAAENTSVEADTVEINSSSDENSNTKTTTVEEKAQDVEFTLDASQKHELKEAGYTDSEIEAIENYIKKSLAENPGFNVYEFVTSKVNEKKSVNEENKLEFSEEAKPEAVVAEETREAKDVSNDVQSKYVALTEEGHETKGTVKPDAGEAIGWEVSFTSPKGTKAGDYFTIDLSDNLSLKGIEPDHENEYPIDIDGKVVADGVRTDRSTIKYTFNENINDERNVVVSVKGFAYIDKTKVPNNTQDEKISIALGDTVDEHNINVQYGDPYYTGDKLNGMSQFTEFDPKTGEFTQVFYINPESETITTSTRNWATGKVVAFIDGITPDGSHSDVNYTEENTTVTVQKLPAGTKVPDAIIENPVKTDEPTTVKTTFRDGGIEIVFADNSDDKLRKNNIDSPYIITVKSKAAPSQTGNNVYSRATFYGDGSKFHIMDNNIVTTVGDTEAQGEKIGYFKEHHVYYTKVDGVFQKDKTFTLHSNKTEGHDYDKYFTSKNVIDDFKFIKVDTGKLVENPVYNEDGTIARGNYEPGKTKEVTYIYERDITSGKFQEHHIYQTVDEKGNVLTTDDTVNKDETKGIDEDSYKTSKIDRDGYTLTEVKATNDESAKLGVKFDSKGVETTGNYVNGKKLEVTYIYQKTEKKGSFQEHHIYQTKKLDGTIVKDDEVNKDVTEGTEKENYKTSKEDRDGYKLIEVKSANGGQFNKDGSEKEAAYIADTKQEVTYIYQKEEAKPWTPIEETGKFQEHHVYRTLDKDGKVIKEEKVDGDVTGGTSKMTYTTGKIDKEGFEYKRTETPVEDPTFNEDGSKATGNFKPGVKQEITYVYEKTQTEWTPIEETGKFQEHHVYRTLDKDGKVIKEEKVDGDVTGGTSKMTYTTDKIDKEGFEYKRTETPVEDPTFNEDGSKAIGYFKPVVKQEITYVYEKTVIEWTPLTPAEKNGSFQEHHVYEVYKDGKLVESSEITLEETTGTEEEYFTTSAKPNGTKDQPKEGFKLVKELIAKSIDVESHLTGEEIKEHYKNNEKLEVRYVYRKDITTPTTPEIPWTPLEPSEPVTPVEPEEPTTPVVPDQPEEPATPVEPETPGEDPKETPWTPLTPAEEVTPQTPDDNETPKEDPKETPKEDSKETPKEDSKETSEKQSKKLPKAGADYELLQLAAGALTLVSGMGISLSRKKRD